MDDTISFLFALILSFILGFSISNFLEDVNGIETKNPITPELNITIKNNVADTTYIYKKKYNIKL